MKSHKQAVSPTERLHSVKAKGSPPSVCSGEPIAREGVLFYGTPCFSVTWLRDILVPYAGQLFKQKTLAEDIAVPTSSAGNKPASEQVHDEVASCLRCVLGPLRCGLRPVGDGLAHVLQAVTEIR